MADPYDRCQTGMFGSKLQGSLLRYFHVDDRDPLLADGPPAAKDLCRNPPPSPRHAPCSLMTAAVYELLCQAYSFVNSSGYRQLAVTRPAAARCAA